MIYDTKNRLLLNDKSEISLTNLQHRFLLLLSNNTIITYEEIARCMYDTDIFYVKGTIKSFLKRFKQKTHLNITTIKGRGLILEDEIYFQ